MAVLYSDVGEHSSLDDLDVLMQVQAVSSALRELGHKPSSVPMSLDMQIVLSHLSKQKPDFVFNLVESLNGVGRFLHFAPMLLDHLGIPYSGASAHALYMTTGKTLSKNMLQEAGLSTPAWFSTTGADKAIPQFSPPYIVKPVWEDASVGIDDESLVFERDRLPAILELKTSRFGECLVEAFIDGREFNLSLLGGANEPEVLPVAEMLFRDFPADKAHIVDYHAKWHTDSFEYRNTVRTFDLSPKDSPMIKRMQEISLRCWDLFQLRGYARVDFRVDKNGDPWILEVNANPCISPDSGFFAAAMQAELSYEEVINRIIQDSVK